MAEIRLKSATPSSFFLLAFRANWWMVVFLSLLALFSWQSMRKKQATINDLKERFYGIVEESRLATAERDDLLLQIHSQNDPEWVELTLMRRLGLVPEGQMKVYFETSTQ